jgi:hypothetical protein
MKQKPLGGEPRHYLPTWYSDLCVSVSLSVCPLLLRGGGLGQILHLTA